MTFKDRIAASGISASEARLLIAHAVGVNSAWLMAHESDEPDASVVATMEDLFARRRHGEPVAYLIGEKEFYGRPFAVDRSTLIPRPATEALIDLAIATLRDPKDRTVDADTSVVCVARILRPNAANATRIVDIGTGSGCIAVTIACELPAALILTTDVSPDALSMAKRNADRHGVADRITFALGATFEPLSDLDEPYVIVSNPPYVPSSESLMRDVADFEPHGALFAGEDGGDIVREIMRGAVADPRCMAVCVECRAEHVGIVTA